MLGVRREAVTEAAGKLQAAGMIQYRRGHITVIDRPCLEARVCECYKVVKRELDRLFVALPAAVPITPRSRPSPATLRQRAEARLQQTEEASLPAIPKNAEHLAHELQVHQIELERHNEELRQAYEEAAAFRTRYVDIYDFAPIGYVTIDTLGASLGAFVDAVAGANAGVAHKEGWLADLVHDAIANGQVVLVAQTLNAEQTDIARKIVGDAAGEFQDVVSKVSV